MKGLYNTTIRRWLGLVCATMCLLVFPYCTSKPPIRIGFLAGTSGSVADLGISGRDAVQMRIDACNRQGGLDGRQVQLIIKDDQQNPELARQAVRELIDAGVEALIGPMTSTMGIAVTPLLNDARLVAVSPTVTTQNLIDKDDYLFRMAGTARETASRSAIYHAQRGDIKQLAVTYDVNNHAYCETWLDSFTNSYTHRGGTIVKVIGFNTQSGRTFLDLSRELLAKTPDGILIIANSMDAALICQQIRKLDAQMYITLAEWGATERLLELGGSAVEGVTVIQPFDRENQSPAYQAFRKTYLNSYQREPGFPGVNAYDAAQVILTALKAKKEGQDLKAVILKLREFDGLQGRLRFNDFGDAEMLSVSISIVRNHTFVPLQ